MNSIISSLLDLPACDWQSAIDTFSSASNLNDTLRAELDDTAERCAYLAEYISQRAGIAGTGNKTHTQAAKAARKQMMKVSKALGYTFADRRAFNI
jgi:hypothetical protein